MRSSRAVISVLDGCGVGAMPDVQETRHEDIGANTIGHVAKEAGGIYLPTLQALGLGNIAKDVAGVPATEEPLASYGLCMLAYDGADTYLGHQELMGTTPKKHERQLLRDVGDYVERELIRNGYKVLRPIPGKSPLLVNDSVLVADNLENDPGVNINVTAPLDEFSFEEAVSIGKIVRRTVKVARVIVLGSTGYGTKDILSKIESRPSGQVGVNTPALGVYNENYKAQNMGFDVNVEGQLPTILTKYGYEVHLVGKVAELIRCERARYLPGPHMESVFANIVGGLKSMHAGLIVANVQETDLAGHDEDPEKFAQALIQVDKHLHDIIQFMRETDILVITADHGNDPTDGSGKQTRELAPLLVYRKKSQPIPLGTRKTLADISATLSEFFGVAPPESGKSFYQALKE